MDYNDYLNVPANVKSTGIARYVPAIVVLSAFSGFIALAWYAYHNGSHSLNEDELIVVEADKSPIKDKPLDPGGMKFPNQDKTIFDNFSRNAQPAKVEHVLPQPEEPMPKTMDASQTTTWVNSKLLPETKESLEPASEAPAAESGAAQMPAATASVPMPPKPDPALLKGDNDIKTFKAPVKTPEKPVVPAAPVKLDKPAAPAAKGTAKIQLGAYRSEKEAQDAFAKIQKKFHELDGKKPSIVKADLGAKGIFYRLRVGGVGSAADAKSLCQKLSGKGQACLVAAE